MQFHESSCRGREEVEKCTHTLDELEDKKLAVPTIVTTREAPKGGKVGIDRGEWRVEGGAFTRRQLTDKTAYKQLHL